MAGDDSHDLLRRPDRGVAAPVPPVEPSPAAEWDVDGMDLFRKLWRRKGLIVAAMIAGGLLATVATATMTPRYKAETRVLLGVEKPNIADIQSLLQETTPNREVIQSESLVLESRNLAARVVHRLALEQDPEFNPALREKPAWRQTLDNAKAGLKDLAKMPLRGLGLIGRGSGSVALPPDPEEQRRRQEQVVVSALLSRIDVVPLQHSRVLSVNAQSENPETAARIADTLARTYIEQQMIRRSRVSEDAAVWLDQRIAELRDKVEQSERATEEYRRRHGLFETRSDNVTAQQVAELNSQLVVAETDRAAADSRLAQVTRVEGDRGAVAALPAVVNSPMVQALVQRQVDAERQAAELATTLGPRHPKMRDIKAQIADIEARIDQEVGKVIQALRHEVQASRERVAALRGELDRLQDRLGDNNEKMIRLHELERQAEANRRLLVSFLERSKETAALPNATEPDSMVISEAALPLWPSYPPKTMLQLLGAIGGVLVGMVLALLSENLDRTFRTPRQVEQATRLPILGILPPSARRSPEDPPDRYDSPFGQAVRKLCERVIFAPGARRGRSVMLTSATPKEGKSQVAMALARGAADNGLRVIIVDCDWRRPTVNRHFGRAVTPGLGELLAGSATPDEVVFRDPATGAHAIFAGSAAQMPNSIDRLALIRMLLETLTRYYDLVIVDTPPLMVSPDGLALARLTEEVAFIARWGKTPRELITTTIRELAVSGAHIGGVVLTDVNPRQYRLYGMGNVVYPYPSGYTPRAA